MVKDFVPVALICTAPNVMVVSPDTEVSNVAEFVAYAKANAGKVNYSSGGIGSSSHLSGELSRSLAGVEMTHIPYKGASPAVTAALADEVNIMIWQGLCPVSRPSRGSASSPPQAHPRSSSSASTSPSTGPLSWPM